MDHDDELLDPVDPCEDPSFEEDETAHVDDDIEEMTQKVQVVEGPEKAPGDNSDDRPHQATKSVLGAHPLLYAAKCPIDIGSWRKKIFELREPVVMTGAEYRLIWPYCDNMWVFRNKSHEEGEYWIYRCLFGGEQRATQGAGHRQRKLKTIHGCPCKLKITPLLVGNEIVGYTLTGRGAGHNHDHNLEMADMRKLNTGIGAVVKQQVGLGLAPPAVLKCVRAQYDPVAFAHFIDAGGAKLKGQTGLQSVHNIGKSSERSHPGLRVGDGVKGDLSELMELEDWLRKGE